MDRAMGSYYASPRFLNMERVHPQRPASPPLFIFNLTRRGRSWDWISHQTYLLTLATPDPNVEEVNLLALVAFSHFL